MEPIDLFFSYSHRDEKLRDKLALHLAMLQRQGVIKSWHDRKISAGTEWAQAIDDNLNAAGIILLLVSDSFLASDYCYDIEMKRAIARHEAGEARVIPIILKPVDWSGAPFSKLQAFPKNAKPVTTWSNRDQAFTDIAQGIRQAAIELMEVLHNRRSSLLSEPKSNTHSRSHDEKWPEIPEVAATSGVAQLVRDVEGEAEARSVDWEELGGQVPLESPFYVERPPIEARCYEAIVKAGALIRIKAPRQMGKSSLMLRILNHANQHNYRSAWLNFQAAEEKSLENLDNLLRWLCSRISRKLGLKDRVEEYWQGALGSNDKCTDYFELYILEEIKVPLALGLDEVDQLFQYEAVASDFFGLLRSWHEEAKFNPVWRNLRLILAHSKEVYIPLNINQSPFNVGLPVDLPPLNDAQVADLIDRHGLKLSPREAVNIMDLTGGHPYLLRVALYHLARREISVEQLMQNAPTAEWIYGDHLRRHLYSLQEHPELLEAMRQVIATDEPIRIEIAEAFKLASMGLVRFSGNDVVPLCDLYRQYFSEMLGG